ncbi:MAG: hypothetical protein HY695_21730 [Deltaproteobacteria bacterium]|nr:hypothetical protein [Deltaproteobacteria bacterium]
MNEIDFLAQGSKEYANVTDETEEPNLLLYQWALDLLLIRAGKDVLRICQSTANFPDFENAGEFKKEEVGRVSRKICQLPKRVGRKTRNLRNRKSLRTSAPGEFRIEVRRD